MVHLFKPTSYRFGAALAVGSTLVWKLISFANALLIAAYFGAGSSTDIYFYLIMLMGFGVTFLQKMNQSVIIPEAMALETKTFGSGRNLLNIFFYLYVALLLMLAIIGYTSPIPLARLFSRFETALLLTNKTLLQMGFVLFGLQLLTNYLLSVLEMYRRFSTTLLSPLNALLPLIFLICFGKNWGIISMIYGFLTAHFIQITVLLIILKKELGWNFGLRKPSFQQTFTKNLISNQFIETANIISTILPLYLLSGLSAGLVSALNYAKQLSDSPTEILTFRVANISKIQLTESATEEKWEKVNRDFLAAQHFLLFLLTPLAIFTCFYAPEIINLFFKRGKFDALDTYQAAAFLRPLMGIMWFVALVSMQNNIVAAGRKVKESLPYALFCIGLFIVSVPITMHFWGGFAYPYTQLACCVVGLAANYLFFKRYFPRVAYILSLKEAARLVAINVLAIFPVAFWAWFIPIKGVFWALLSGGIIFLMGLFFWAQKSGDWKIFSSQLRPK
jgi:putative peptidoglycan lipid II flippase